MNLPTTPSDGQIVTLGNKTYTWSSSSNSWKVNPVGSTYVPFSNTSIAPANAPDGWQWWDSNLGILSVKIGGVWVEIGGSGNPGISQDPWTPAQLTPSGWWSSDNAANTMDSNNIVSVLADRSTNSVPATGNASYNAGRLIPNFLNSRGVIRGQGSDNQVARYSFGKPEMTNNVPGATIGIVHKLTSSIGTSEGAMFSINVGTGNFGRIYLGRGGFSSNCVYGGGRRLDGDSGQWAVDNTDYGVNWLICIISLDYANRVATLSVNGKVTTLNNFQSGGNTSSTNSSSQDFGHQTGSSPDHYMSEGLVIPTYLSELNRQKLEGYLAWEWGLQSSLISTHPYISNRP